MSLHLQMPESKWTTKAASLYAIDAKAHSLIAKTNLNNLSRMLLTRSISCLRTVPLRTFPILHHARTPPPPKKPTHRPAIGHAIPETPPHTPDPPYQPAR